MNAQYGTGLMNGLAVAARCCGISAFAAGITCWFDAPAPAQALSSVQVATGFVKPVYVTHAPGDTHRLFVVEQGGKIKVVKDGVHLLTPFLDVAGLVNAQGLEYGLLMLVFHPNYQSNGFFYVYYTTTTGVADPIVARYSVTANPDVADPMSGARILHISYNIGNHRAGWMDFGPDGHLYITTGDGGEQDPQNNAQNLAVLKGKILRLDTNGPDGIPGTADDDGFPADLDRNYTIPADNPFVSTPGAAPELWAYGLRNPWRCSMDRLTHNVWIGDVGQLAREEIDFQPAGLGGAFYGWRCIEGTVPTNYAGCTNPLPPSVPPVHEYPHSAVIGGYVYRGCAIPWLQGTYLYGDWGGGAWSFRYSPQNGMTEFTNRTAELLSQGNGILSSFGEDALGEIHFCLMGSATVPGVVRKVVPAVFVGPDCNNNLVNDACDIAAGTSPDVNHNGVPDECDPPPPACPPDVNQSGAVDIDDLLAVINSWGPVAPGNPADINQSGNVDLDDLLAVITGWGPCR